MTYRNDVQQRALRRSSNFVFQWLHLELELNTIESSSRNKYPFNLRTKSVYFDTKIELVLKNFFIQITDLCCRRQGNHKRNFEQLILHSESFQQQKSSVLSKTHFMHSVERRCIALYNAP